MKIMALLSLLMVAAVTQAKVLTIAVEPTYPSEQLKEIFKPLGEWLKSEVGYDLKVVTSQNYYFYWKNAVNKRPDLTFDAPHIASYRMQENGYRPLVATKEPTIFHLVMDQDKYPQKISDIDLISKRIATVQHPSIASILYEKWFAGSVVMPSKILANYSWVDGVNSIFDGQADATIIPGWLLSLYPNFKSVKQSKPLAGMTILASPTLSDELVEKIRIALLNMKNNDSAYDALVELNTEYFIDASQTAYSGLVELFPDSYLSAAKMHLADQ